MRPNRYVAESPDLARLLVEMEKLTDQIGLETSDEKETLRVVLLWTKDEVFRQLGAGPYVVISSIGDELADLSIHDEYIETSVRPVAYHPHGNDQYGWYGNLKTFRCLTDNTRIVQLYQYADGGPPPLLIVMTKEDLGRIPSERLESVQFGCEVVVAE